MTQFESRHLHNNIYVSFRPASASECSRECSPFGLFYLKGRDILFIGSREYFLNQILDADEEALRCILDNIEENYHAFQIPKKGGTRTIQAIDKSSPLYSLQRNLNKNFLEKIPLPIPVTGFVKGESYLTFLKPHTGKRYFLRLDIKNYFDTITVDMIKSQFKEFFGEDDKEDLADLSMICTLDGRLPQGAVTSPAVSNIVFRRTDQRILKYCQSFDLLYLNNRRFTEDICYTRYADDMLFSSNHLDFSKETYFTGMISGILQSTGFQLNRGKIKTGQGEISLSGFVLSDNIHLSRKKLYSLNRLLFVLGKTQQYTGKTYRVKKTFFQQPDWLDQINALYLKGGHGDVRYFSSHEQLLDYLCGYRALLVSVLKINHGKDQDMRQLCKKIKKLEAVIDCILECA